jgi:hypothetical protein
MIQIEKQLVDLETKARSLITEIVPLIGKIPKAALSELTEFLDDALKAAKINLDIAKTQTQRRSRPPWVSRMFMTFLVLTLLPFFGCVPAGYVKPTENQKQLNAQNEDAGKMIAAKAVDPDTVQAGKDVTDNSVVLRKTLIGAPETPPKPYSPQTSAEIRTITVKEYDESKAPWYKRWAGTLISGLGVLLVAATGLARYFPATAAIANIIHPIAVGLVGMKQDADANTSQAAPDTLHIDQIQQKITGWTKLPFIGPILEKALAKAHLEALVHSPEGPDPAPAATATPAA